MFLNFPEALAGELRKRRLQMVSKKMWWLQFTAAKNKFDLDPRSNNIVFACLAWTSSSITGEAFCLVAHRRGGSPPKLFPIPLAWRPRPGEEGVKLDIQKKIEISQRPTITIITTFIIIIIIIFGRTSSLFSSSRNKGRSGGGCEGAVVWWVA